MPASGSVTRAGSSSSGGSGGTVQSANFTRVLKAEPLDTEVFQREETVTFDYNGLADEGTADATATWKVVRFEKTLGNIVRIRYRTGVAWSARAAGW